MFLVPNKSKDSHLDSLRSQIAFPCFRIECSILIIDISQWYIDPESIYSISAIVSKNKASYFRFFSIFQNSHHLMCCHLFYSFAFYVCWLLFPFRKIYIGCGMLLCPSWSSRSDRHEKFFSTMWFNLPDFRSKVFVLFSSWYLSTSPTLYARVRFDLIKIHWEGKKIGIIQFFSSSRSCSVITLRVTKKT